MWDNTNIIIVILLVLLVGVVGFLGYEKYVEYNDLRDSDLYRQGLEQGRAEGYQSAIVQLANEASSCQPVPVNLGNVSFNVIAVECLQ